VGDSARRETSVIEVAVLYCPDGSISSSIAPLEVFYAAGSKWNPCVSPNPEPRFSITTVSADGLPVTGAAGVKVVPDQPLSAVERADLVLIPSAGPEIDSVIEKNRTAIPWVRALHDNGSLIAGVCTGVAILAEAGLIDGRRATTHWAVADAYQQRYPKVDWQPQLCVTEDRGMVCGGGVYASIDLSLYLVEKLCGRDIALACAKSLVVQMPRTYQTGFAVLPHFGRDHADAVVRRAEDWLHNHFPDDIDLDRLAGELALTPRTFLRRFKAATGETPLAYLQRLRTEAAKRILEDDRMTVQEVSLAVGYEDVAFFRDLFKRHAGLAPGAYRERYGPSVRQSAHDLVLTRREAASKARPGPGEGDDSRIRLA
jgi:transcriptional regulator GlxA family with amidase domain